MAKKSIKWLNDEGCKAEVEEQVDQEGALELSNPDKAILLPLRNAFSNRTPTATEKSRSRNYRNK
jgi:hypothetical protein